MVSAWQCRRQLFVHRNKLIWRVIEVSCESLWVRFLIVTGWWTACPVTAALAAHGRSERWDHPLKIYFGVLFFRNTCMGLLISHLKTLEAFPDRELYIFLLDYNWPDGKYEKIFKTHFQTMAKRASDSNSVVVGSNRGIHFANEVLSFYRVFDLNADKVLPAILITKAHPSYFVETIGPEEHPIKDPTSDDLCRDDVVLIPLKDACSSAEEFSTIIESIFSDLDSGTELQNFSIAEYDTYHQYQENRRQSLSERIGNALILEPNLSGMGVDLRKLFA